jgi:2'-5' RNA ligase
LATIRSFLALEVSSAVAAAAERLIRVLASGNGPPVRWVERQDMHITLKFFGDIAPELTSDICRRVQQVLDGLSPFEIKVVGVGAFPRSDRPRTIWAGVSAGSDRLIELADRIESVLEPLGLPRERRRFHPHLTLGRVKGSSPLAPLAARIEAIDVAHELGVTSVRELLLLSSELKPSGPVYGRMATLALGG